MSQKRVFITGMGAVTPAGTGWEFLKTCFKTGKARIKPLSLFQTPQAKPLPVGEITGEIHSPNKAEDIPRTHKLAYLAAQQAMSKADMPPDAVIMGVTTGGLDKTEVHLKNAEYDPDNFKYHGTSTVAEYIARKFKCRGIVITISTACSSGAAAIKLGLELLKTGRAKSVLPTKSRYQ